MEVQVHLLLLLSVILSSDAEKEKNLTAIEGGSITFPQPVLQRGSLIYGGLNIAMVTERKAEIPRDPWKDKVHWNNTTGFFTITELQTSDSGIYSVDAMNGDAAVYKLTVFVIISSNAETEKNLTAIEGGSITFPQPVFQLGSLIYGGMNIAMVTERKANIPRDPWKDKVHWNNTTGIFTITELQTSDSGIYTVHAMNGDAAFYKLTVFEPILILPVVRVNVTTESCTLLCAVEKPAGTTLWWSKDRKKVKQSSSSLSLPLTITQDFSSSYKCEAATPAEVKSLEVIVTELCSEGKNSEDENTDQTNAVGTKVAISVVLTLLVLGSLAGFLIVRKRFKKGQSTPPGTTFTTSNTTSGPEQPVNNLC
ncbi:uncharacterized protein LOC142880634 isoform X2 [Nelusetta ayraudi]|uniref:uncharacterized protein LOC142880634 isoform X2 n=1 Tax=Nelusetta ayraudi TaxID=303726 RepID=UPI003F6EB171